MKSKYWAKKFLLVFMAITLAASFSVQKAKSEVVADMASFTEQNDVSPKKIWTLQFKNEVNPESVRSNIKISDSNGEKVKANIDSYESRVTIYPPQDGYKLGETYYLDVSKDLLSTKTEFLIKEPIQIKFTISDMKFLDGVEKIDINQDSSITKANNTLGSSLIKQLVKQNNDDNTVISPLSLSSILTLTENGANGDTKKEILNLMNLDESSSTKINDEYYNLLFNYKYAQPDPINLCNSIWINNGTEVENNFLDLGKKYYNSEISTLDFSDPNSVNIINQWVAQNTDNTIPDIIKEIPPSSKMILANTIYFKGRWINEFYPESTKKEAFTLKNNEKFDVDMMNAHRYTSYLETDDFQAVQLPYTNGMDMCIFLPKEGTSIDDFIQKVSDDNLRAWMKDFSHQDVKLKIPKFKVATDENLVDSLKALGMLSAFDPDKSDFDAIAKDLHIDQIKQKCSVDVDEKGTVASAATVEFMTGSAAPSKNPPEFYVNRPFFFGIRDSKTGMFLFMGKIENPLK